MKFLSRKVLAWGAVALLAGGLTFVKVQCRQIDNLKVDNVLLKQEISNLKYEVESAKATIKTHELIRKGPAAIAGATDKIELRIKPKKGETVAPTEVIKEGDKTFLKVDSLRQAQIVSDAELVQDKIIQIGHLDLQIGDLKKLLKKARRTRMRNTVIGGAVGVGVTVLIVKLLKK